MLGDNSNYYDANLTTCILVIVNFNYNLASGNDLSDQTCLVFILFWVWFFHPIDRERKQNWNYGKHGTYNIGLK